MIEELNKKASLEMLKSGKLGRLCCVMENREPHVVPVNYVFKEGFIYIHSLPGLKIDVMRLNPKVCLQIDVIADGGLRWKSVIASGEYEEIVESEEKSKILNEFIKKFPRFTPVEANFTVGNSLEKIIVFRIKDLSLTGVSENW